MAQVIFSWYIFGFTLKLILKYKLTNNTQKNRILDTTLKNHFTFKLCKS